MSSSFNFTHAGSPGLARWLTGAALTALILPLLMVSVSFADPADHLIISELMIMTRSPASTFGSPFVAITNPTAGDLDLSDVYLTDGTTAPSAFYYNIALGNLTAANPGGGNGGDFHARFPAGFVLPAGETLVISLKGSTEFVSAYGRTPDFELFEDSPVPDNVPELREAFPGSINAGPLGGTNIPVLSDVAESLVLYSWDGSSDQVIDLDYVMWGTNPSPRVDKTGVTIGAHTYLADTAVASQEPVAAVGPTFRHSFRRVSTDEGTETLTGGNGLNGHDETSENLATTWADVTPPVPADDLAEIFPSAPIVTALESGNAYGGQEVTVTAEVVTFGTMAEVTFHYSVDGGAYASVAGTDAGSGSWEGTIPAQAEDAVVSFYCVAENADGGMATYPVAAPFFGTATYTVEEAPAPPTVAHKLLISEVSTGQNIYPFTGMEQIAMEFIEIHNPNDFTVDMSDYYLTDAINYNFSTQLYWFITQGDPAQDTIGGGHYNDFHARFPAGFMLEAGGTITISMAGSGWFEAYFGILPDLEMYEDAAEPDLVPDMRPVFVNPGDDLPGDSIFTADRPTTSGDQLPKGIPEMEEFYGEPLILYHFVEGAELVTDIDIFVWGDERTGSYRYGFAKTGPVYQPDTEIDLQDWYLPLDQSGTLSYTRVDAEEGTQATSGGNGVDGRDETSENVSDTFDLLGFSPGFFLAGGGGDVTAIKLMVPAATFNPYLGENFPIQVVSRSNSETRVRVFDREGRLVVSLYDSRFDGEASSFSELPTRITWDGRSDTYDRVPAGMYILHLSVVDDATGEEETQTVPVVVATRLSN
jgi:hypothetical protein